MFYTAPPGVIREAVRFSCICLYRLRVYTDRVFQVMAIYHTLFSGSFRTACIDAMPVSWEQQDPDSSNRGYHDFQASMKVV